jgi:hypothetical protein
MNDGETRSASSPPSQPLTPTPEDDPSVPLPGRTGIHISDHSESERDRDAALHDIPVAGNHPVTGVARVRDVQPPIMLHNPYRATSTTVEYLPEAESRA